ncbi:hypothetical protein L208DRAFT_1378750 [Tricholoma matsutake]|nr:hypothetical protein L208DRAFT_1378750 [Tricholoma matsutake 945]
MTSSSACGLWSSGARSGVGRLHPNTQRQGSASDPDIVTYSYGQSFVPEFVGHLPDSSEASSNSSLTSTLTGAIGSTSLSSHSGQSSSATQDDACYPASDWNTDQQIDSQQLSLVLQNPSYSVAGLGNMAFMPGELTANSTPFPGYSCASRTSYNGSDSSMSAEGRLEKEVTNLRRKVRELEIECARARSALETMRTSAAGCGYSGLSTPVSTPPPSSAFQASWKARTEARMRMFCSLNRAGNALCAWHDSRRERRAFPPRNAPPGYLNCGCTHEQALFEESLARHDVGSYHPGETVRMDPALRNPLLKLLQQRYCYQDGDFERNPITGDWVENEGPAYWEFQAHSGAAARRRPDHAHSERH